jgi:3',5'-cyclic AMP phosphodiesterase CpdA
VKKLKGRLPRLETRDEERVDLIQGANAALTWGMIMAGQFRIVHLSDLHLTKSDKDRRTSLEVFKPLKGMNSAFREIIASKPVQDADLILLTGDITDRGDLESWQIFWDTVTSAGIFERILVLPGNHDVCCLGARLPSRSNGYKTSDLKKAIQGLEIGGQPVDFPWTRIPDPRVVVFGMNSNNLGNLNIATNAMGEIGYFQLVKLASKMYQFRDIPIKIIALHHSPNIPNVETAVKRGQRPFNKLDRLGHQIPQDQRHALLLLSITHRVRLVIHGHLHMSEDRRVGGVRIVGASSSTEPIFSDASRCDYEIHQYTVSGDGKRVLSKTHVISVLQS